MKKGILILLAASVLFSGCHTASSNNAYEQTLAERKAQLEAEQTYQNQLRGKIQTTKKEADDCPDYATGVLGGAAAAAAVWWIVNSL